MAEAELEGVAIDEEEGVAMEEGVADEEAGEDEGVKLSLDAVVLAAKRETRMGMLNCILAVLCGGIGDQRVLR